MFFNRVWVKTIVYFCVENEQFYAAMSYHTGASACGQRCAVLQRNKSAPWTYTKRIAERHERRAGNYMDCTLCEARTCTYVHVHTYVRTCSHMRSSFIDFRDGRFTEGVINWLRVASKRLQKRNLFFTCVRTAANTVCKHLVSPFRTQRSFINFHSQIILDSILLNVIWNSRTPLAILSSFTKRNEIFVGIFSQIQRA